MGSTGVSFDATKVELLRAAAELTAAINDYVATPAPEGAEGAVLEQRRRRDIVDATDRVQRLVKDPADQWIDVVYPQTLATTKRLFYDWGVFEAIPPEGSISYADLAAKVDAEEVLLARLGNILVGAEVLGQVGKDAVAHTDSSRIFLKGHVGGQLFNLSWDNCLTVYPAMPKYFETYGRKEPQTSNHIPFSFAYGLPEQGFYDVMSADPAKMATFIPAMAAVESRMPVAGVYDFSWVVSLLADAEKAPAADRPVLVDVGGGKGHAIKAIVNEFPGLPLDRCVLQDRPDTIDAVVALDEPELKGVTKQGIDFFKEQPVKGALLYFIRRCLHNHPEAHCEQILKHLVEAAAVDSKILIFEDVLDTPPHYTGAIFDFMMLGMGGKQRTQEGWEKLLAKVGLKIASISRGQGPWRSQCVIECVKV
ncbi:O-methyltransferase [Podospora didyma]|uniref:O-methyltransferase n=1 Tax=Podospora didyma TaxID=330526 RepID=A0AAE0NGN7_9PEZI|nr:O-methyltransferase [Podospora didyma]